MLSMLSLLTVALVAVLQITGDAYGSALDPAALDRATPMLTQAGWALSEEEGGASEPLANTELAAPAATAVPPTSAPEVEPQEEVGEDRHQGTIPDVTMYRDNSARNGKMPGPDPDGQIGELWRVETGQKIFSSPAVVDGVVYVGMGGPQDQTGAVLALDATTGIERWRFEAGSFTSSPSVRDDRVYIASLDGYLYALNATNGTVFETYQPTGGVHCSSYSAPLVVRTMVIANFGCQRPVDTSDPGSWTDLTGRLAAFDVESGSELWSFTTNGFSPGSSPAVSDGIMVVADTLDEEFSAGTIHGLDAATGAELWRFDAQTGFEATPAIENNRVFLTGRNGQLYALYLKTGVEIWRFDLGQRGGESPAVADGIVYAGTYGTAVFALDAKTGMELWKSTTAWQSGAAPAVTDATIYLAENFKGVTALDRATGAADLERSIPNDSYRFMIPATSPAISGGVVFVTNSAGVIAAYGDIRTTVPIKNGMAVAVLGERTLLRAAPSDAAVVRGELQPETRLQVTGAAEERDSQTWWPVEAPDLGPGWVPASAIVAADVTPTPVPTRTPPPTSTPAPTPVPPTSTPASANTGA